MTIGQRLRESREAQHLTLDTLQEMTKIQKRYLAAIEEENFQILPGKFYAKAFIKEYANAVGLDATELLEEFDNHSTESDTEQKDEYTRIKQSPSDSNPSKNTGSLLPKITVFLLIVGIIIAALYFYQKTASDSGGEEINNDNNTEELNREPIEDEQIVDTTDEDDVSDTDKDVKKNDKDSKKKPKKKKDDKEKDEDKVIFNVIEKDEAGTPQSTIEAENTGDKVKLKVSASEGNSWLTIKKGNTGEQVFSEDVTSTDEPKEFDFDKVDELNFIVGNASVLKIEVNGEPIEYPIDRDQRVFQKIKLIIK